MERLAVIGLDCADPRVVFDELIDEMPNVRSLLAQAAFGRLRSVNPPITIPAWVSMVTGKDPGELGIYGFQDRATYDYSSSELAHSGRLSHPTVWDVLGKHGLRSVLLGVPMTYPPRPLQGCMVSGLLTPNTASTYTYPPSLATEIEGWVGEYVVDIHDFRTVPREQLLQQIHRMTEVRFEVARRLLATRAWDFFMMVDMGPDRVHHGFWSHYDPTHPRHDPHSAYRKAIPEYYAFLDSQIGQLVDQLPPGTHVLLVSDHGVQSLQGGICINEWLIQEGHLVLREYPRGSTPMRNLIERGLVDWEKTVAWGAGGYCGRVFFNVKGREPKGILQPQEIPSLCCRLGEALRDTPDDAGCRLDTIAYAPSEAYREVRGIPADLLVHFDDLAWRSLGTVGGGSVWSRANDLAPDDANHRRDGLWVLFPSDEPGREDRHIQEVFELVLSHFGIRGPEETTSGLLGSLSS